MIRATGDLKQLVYPGHPGELGYPGHTEELGLPGRAGKLGYPGQTSPTTIQPVQLQSKIYSLVGSMNRATGDLEQIVFVQGELDYPASISQAAQYSPEDSEYGDGAHCRAAFHRPVVESIAEPEETPLLVEQLFTDHREISSRTR